MAKPHGSPPNRGHGSRHARPLGASIGARLSASPHNAVDRMASEVAGVSDALDKEARERREREERFRARKTQAEGLERLERDVVELKEAIDRNTEAIKENTMMLRRALGLDPVPIGAPVIDPSAVAMMSEIHPTPDRSRET